MGQVRYVVTEIGGDLSPRGSGNRLAPLGMSCHVIDTAWNHRLVATFRTEDIPGQSRTDPTDVYVLTQDERRARVRVAAATRCDLLNRRAREAQGAVA